MSRPIPEHGTPARRRGNSSRPPCQCSVCVKGARRAGKTERTRRSRGITGEVPVGPASAHVRGLVDSGRTITGIAEDADVDWMTVYRTLHQIRDSILRTTAVKLLAVKPRVDEDALVDATGTVRRVRALVAMGHTQQVLSDEVGCAFTYITNLAHGRRPTVTRALARSVQLAYDKLSMTVGLSVRGRLKAQRLGWHGPLAWDDDTIDDPQAVPQTDALEPAPTQGDDVAARFLMGESVVLDRAARREALAYLMEWTDQTVEQVGEQLEMSPDAVDRAWERIKARAKDQGGKVPWRRVYVPRRELNRNEMESAA